MSLFTIPHSPPCQSASIRSSCSLTHSTFPAGANLPEYCIPAKGRKRLNRGSILPPYLPIPFLSSAKMPRVGNFSKTPLSVSCMYRIEPRFEPRTTRGRLQGSSKMSTSTHSTFILRSLNTEHRKLITDDHSPFSCLITLPQVKWKQPSTFMNS